MILETSFDKKIEYKKEVEGRRRLGAWGVGVKRDVRLEQ